VRGEEEEGNTRMKKVRKGREDDQNARETQARGRDEEERTDMMLACA
jgi:hypothetical protein